jgi:hypothetical protein
MATPTPMYPTDYGPPFGANFIPNLQYISNITQAQQAVVTFVANHNFTLSEWIGFRIPQSNGMIQLNNQKALVIALTPNTVTIALDTLGYYPFIYYQDPQFPCIAVPVASGIIQGEAATTLEDAFDNEPII